MDGSAIRALLCADRSVLGFRREGTRLLIRVSTEQARPEDLEAATQRLLGKLAKDRWGLERGGVTAEFDLMRVFGTGIMGEYALGAEGRNHYFEIVSVQPDVNPFLVRLTNCFNTRFDLEFSVECDLRRASKDGRSVPVLQDGKRPLGNLADWGGPHEVSLVAEAGSISGQAFTKLFGAGDRRVSMRSVVLPSGEFWIGPAECKLTLIDGRVLGVGLGGRPGSELMVYVDQRTKMPLVEGATTAFAHALGAFEAELDSGRFKETTRINLPTRFPEHIARQGEANLKVRGLRTKQDDLVVRLENVAARADLVVRLSADGNLRSAK